MCSLVYSVLCCPQLNSVPLIFFFNDTATTEIYTLSLHDALPISFLAKSMSLLSFEAPRDWASHISFTKPTSTSLDRKSTRLNSSHQIISYAVFCLKKKSELQDTRSRGTIELARQRHRHRYGASHI